MELIFDKKIVDLNMKVRSKEEAIKHLSGLLKNTGYIDDADEFVEDIYIRESEGITGIGNNIAIPHGKSHSVTKIGIAVGKCENDIEWQSLDGEPVKIIFLFAVSKEQYDNSHLKLLGELAARLGRGNTIENLHKMKTYEDLVAAFSNEEKAFAEDMEELSQDIEISIE